MKSRAAGGTDDGAAGVAAEAASAGGGFDLGATAERSGIGGVDAGPGRAEFGFESSCASPLASPRT